MGKNKEQQPLKGEMEGVLTTSRSENVVYSPNDAPTLEDDASSPFIQAGVTRKNRQAATIRHLDGTAQTFYIHRNSLGEVLFEMVCAQLNLNEKDYFGLVYYDEQNIWHWLYKDKRIKKLLKDLPWHFSFAVKFYTPHPAHLADDFTRYLMCLQLREDVFDERLLVTLTTQSRLAALAAQSEFGDYAPTPAYFDYLKSARLAQVQSDALTQQILDNHKQLKGLTPPQAELAYLNECRELPLYGTFQFLAKDAKGKPVRVGVNWHGISVHCDQIRLHRFAWPNIIKFSYRRNVFTVKLKPGELEKNHNSVAYKLLDYPSAKRLWKCAVEHHTFFRLIQPESKPKGSILRFGSGRFRYQGRTNIQSQMASQLFDGAPSRMASKSAEDVSRKGPTEHSSPLHYADAASRDAKKVKKDGKKKKEKVGESVKKTKKQNSKKTKKGVDVSSASSPSSSSFSSSDSSDQEKKEFNVETTKTRPTHVEEGSLPHTTVHTWHETSAGPEKVSTEVDGNVMKRTVVKTEHVKHTVQTQSYQTFAVDEDENVQPPLAASTAEKPVPPEKASRPAPPKRNTLATATVAAAAAATAPTAYETHTIAYENGSAPQPSDVTNLSHWAVKNGDTSTTSSSAFTEQDLVSRKAVTTGNRTVETLTYKKLNNSVEETHVEHRITIHGGDDVDHDAELSQAILEATNMNPDMTVEKVEVRQGRF